MKNVAKNDVEKNPHFGGYAHDHFAEIFTAAELAEIHLAAKELCKPESTVSRPQRRARANRATPCPA